MAAGKIVRVLQQAADVPQDVVRQRFDGHLALYLLPAGTQSHPNFACHCLVSSCMAKASCHLDAACFSIGVRALIDLRQKMQLAACQDQSMLVRAGAAMPTPPEQRMSSLLW
jgi:hypothetical protein